MRVEHSLYRKGMQVAVKSAAVALLLMISAPPLVAQEPGTEFNEEDFFVEEVVVTGTRIKRRDFSSTSPLTTVSKEEFEFSGQPTLEGYLNQMPQLQPGHDRSSNNPGSGTAQVNLRNLGPGRTLVMLNGRRFAPSGVSSAVDMNNLPGALLQRVEIITGGASTVYGSDAIAGVINFITRNDFEGLSFDGIYNISGEGDAEIWDVNVAYGHNLASGRGNITVFAGQYEREPLLASEREISRTPWTTDWVTTNLYPGGSSRTPDGVVFGPRADLGDGRPVQVTFNPDGTPRAFTRPDDLWNYAPVNYLQIPLNRKTFGIMGNLDISDSMEFYFEGLHVQNEIRRNLAPAPLGAFLVTNTDNPLWAPEMQSVLAQWELEPGIAGMFFARRMLELGNRIFVGDKDYQRVAAGVRGEIWDGWDLDAWVTYTQADEIESILNNGSVSRLQQALLVNPATGGCFDPSGGCVPADVFGAGRLSQEAVDFIRWQPLDNITSREQSLAAIVVTGQPFEIWSGPVDAAFGFEWREDQALFEADPILFSGDVIGIGGDAPINGTENVWELYGETIFTLLESSQSDQKLDVELGVRWSDYKNAGSATTWKAGLDWRINDSWRLRAMMQHAVRAPNNAELFTTQGTFSDAVFGNDAIDPCSASADPVGSGNREKCLTQGLSTDQLGVFEHQAFYPTDFIFGGNPDLQPESSDTFTAGLVISPISVPGLVVAIDYYRLEVTDTIGDIDAMFICFDPLNTEGLFCDNIERDGTGNVFRITELVQNRGLLETDGVDVQVQYSFDLPGSLALIDDFAQLSVNSIWTHVFSNKFQENVVTSIDDCTGYFGWPCEQFSNPDNRITTNINYASGPFMAHLTWRWIDGMTNASPKGSWIFGVPDPVLAIPELPSWSYFDLGFSYEIGDSTTLRFGVNNLADKEPAFMADQSFANNTDSQMYDVFGRSYYLGVSYQFGRD
jgi:outer membrane receptor protein involved in Fe transport